MATNFAGGRLDWALSEVSLYANAAYAEVATRINPHRTKEALAVSSTTSGGNRIALPADYDYAMTVIPGEALRFAQHDRRALARAGCALD